MKLVGVFLFVCMMQVSASSLAQKITLSENNSSLELVLRKIKVQTGYEILYANDALDQAGAVTVKFSNLGLNEGLDRILESQLLTYELRDKTIILRRKSSLVPENENRGWAFIDVQGTASNENGEPLEGISVVIKGTTKGTRTNQNGDFFLKGVNEQAILIFSGVNIETYEVSVKSRRDLGKLYLTMKNNKLSEINVNTGYQSISRDRSAGSFSKPDMEILRNRSTSMNILDRLDGLVPGFTLNKTPLSRTPYTIRGLSTIGLGTLGTGTNRNPLFVVDGVAMDDISSINPQNVLDITVLKDATAASIWGARASNGVIVITTKRGTEGQKLRVEYNGFYNFQGKPDLDYIPVITSAQYIQTARELFNPIETPWEDISVFDRVGGTGIAPHEVILYNQQRGLISADVANKSLDSLASISNHQQIRDLFYRNAATMNHTLALSGGGNVHSFYGALTYTNNTSARPGEKDNTYNLNLRQDFNISDRVQFSLITQLDNTLTSKKRYPEIDYRFYPYQLFQDGNGKNLSVPYMAYLSEASRLDFEARSRVSLDYVPLDEVNYGVTKTDGLRNRLIGSAKVKLFKGLRFEGVYGYVKGTNRTTEFEDQKNYRVRSELVQFTVAPTAASTPVYYLPTSGGQLGQANTIERTWTIRNMLSFDDSWQNNLHRITLIAGQEARETFSYLNSSFARGYNPQLQRSPALDYATLSGPGIVNTVMPTNGIRSTLDPLNPNFRPEFETTTRLVSYFANGGYNFNGKYSLNSSVRVDQSNLFGVDKSAQNKPTWSTGVKWIISEEKFMAPARWLNQLAIRATYGVTGNSPSPGSTASRDILSTSNSSLIPGGLFAGIQTPGNSNLSWERTVSTNLAVDFSVLNRRLTGSVDLYKRNTDGLLGSLPVNPYTGYASITGNYGNISNKGIEVSIQSINVKADDFSWSSSLALAYNKNIVVKSNSLAVRTTGSSMFGQFIPGAPAGAMYAYRFAGLDNLGDPQIYLADNTVTKKRNVTKPEDVVLMGTSLPVWSGGFSNVFRYKNFLLNANAIFNLGHVMRRQTGLYYNGDTNPFYGRGPVHTNAIEKGTNPGFTGGQIHPDFLKRWRKPGDEAFTNVPSHQPDFSGFSNREISYYTSGDVNVVSASYIKLRDISLSYQLSNRLVKHLRAESIVFRVQVSNLMLWKANNDNIDPEFHDARGGGAVPNNDFGASVATSEGVPYVSMPTYRSAQGMLTFGAQVKF